MFKCSEGLSETGGLSVLGVLVFWCLSRCEPMRFDLGISFYESYEPYGTVRLSFGAPVAPCAAVAVS